MPNKDNRRSERVLFTKDMRKNYTILAPMMVPIHFNLIKNVFVHEGYNFELLTNNSHNVVERGLKYVHNDTCYPALLVIGQMIDALESGKYDLDRTALLITQTGGGCRASNYIHLMRKAMKRAGYGHLPIISFNISGMESNPGFKVTIPILRKCIAALIYGDMLMLLSNQTRPYERKPGATDNLVAFWNTTLSSNINSGHGLSMKEMKINLDKIADDFEQLEVDITPKVKVGVVGEIYVKYAALANNNLEGFLASQDCEVMVPGILNFMIFKADNRIEDIKLYGGSPIKRFVVEILMSFFLKMEKAMLDTLAKHPRFNAPSSYHHLKGLVKDIIGYGNKMGEGWLLTAEMVELIESGYGNIVCTQPFGCLPNHICGKGMIHKIREIHPESNIVAIDYDPSATRVNQENRIKLMLSVAKDNLESKSSTTDLEPTYN